MPASQIRTVDTVGALHTSGGNAAYRGALPAPGAGLPWWLGHLLGPLISARTWLAQVYLLANVPLGIVGFVVVIVGVTLGIGLSFLALLGLGVIALDLWACRGFARLQRAMIALMLGVTISPPRNEAPLPMSRWRAALRVLRDRASWRLLLAAALRLPLGILGAALGTAPWSFAIALIFVPAYGPFLPRGGADLWGTVLHGAPTMTGAVLAGTALLLIAPRVTRGLAGLDVALSARLLGPGQRDLSARVGELERSRAAVVDAAETERRRIERDLHDGAQQQLVAIAMDLGRAQARFANDPEGAAALVDQAQEQAKQALVALRDLVRGVHPPVLTDRGLDAALSGLTALSPVPVSVEVEPSERPSPTVEAIAYFVVAEALTNVAKHARASRAEVHVRREHDVLRLTIEDDGVGGADPTGSGLSGLADRVAGVDGHLAIDSPPGGPTVIEVELPCGQ